MSAKNQIIGEKVDLQKLYRAEYTAGKRPCLVEIAPASYLAVEGQGSPDGDLFAQSVGALYRMAEAVALQAKRTNLPFAIPKLEGLWWTDDASDSFLEQPKERWRWKLLLRVPEFIGAYDVTTAEQRLKAENDSNAAPPVRWEPLEEGTCVQMLHTGPYDTEMQTLLTMWEFCGARGLSFHGIHHEIYLSDPRRTTPEKLKTILRNPIRRLAPARLIHSLQYGE